MKLEYRANNPALEPAGLLGRLRALARPWVPRWLVQRRRRRVAARSQQEFGSLTVEEAFTRIYTDNLWGGVAGEFFSGTGSTGGYVEEYVGAVRGFIAEHGITRIVDVGCGDFYVASRLLDPGIRYLGCDVVPELVDHLDARHGTDDVRFRHLDAARDELPDGELCLIRQVLQHLSNDEIQRVLRSARKFPYLLITEHHPAPGVRCVPNLDIPHGPEMRLHFDSAVVLDEPPFSLDDVRLLLDVEAEEGTRLKTFLVVQG